MIRKSGNRFSLATNAKGVCAEIMLKEEIKSRPNTAYWVTIFRGEIKPTSTVPIAATTMLRISAPKPT